MKNGAAIARQLGCHHSVITRLVQNQNQINAVKDRTRCARPKPSVREDLCRPLRGRRRSTSQSKDGNGVSLVNLLLFSIKFSSFKCLIYYYYYYYYYYYLFIYLFITEYTIVSTMNLPLSNI